MIAETATLVVPVRMDILLLRSRRHSYFVMLEIAKPHRYQLAETVGEGLQVRLAKNIHSICPHPNPLPQAGEGTCYSKCPHPVPAEEGTCGSAALRGIGFHREKK